MRIILLIKDKERGIQGDQDNEHRVNNNQKHRNKEIKKLF